MRRRILFIIIILLAAVFTESCAPTKNTATRRFYHNMVSRYNIYFNGKESVRQGQMQLSTNHKDDYTRILELLKYGSEQDANSITPLMDRASEKGSKVVLKHSMNFGGEEFNRWVDDSYLMIGKSRFFKHDYLGAIEMFDFVSKRFNKNQIRYDALLWLAKAYMYSERYSRCDPVFGMIEPSIESGETSKWVKRNFPIVRAQYYIKIGELEQAAEYLEKALQVKQNKKVKARVLFVAGQVNQRLGNNAKALNYYQACIKSNPPYVMAFHAKIFSAECYDADSGGGEHILKELHKMLKEAKNKEYYDVIYYSLANIELKKGNIPEAMDFLKLSVQTSVSNDYQKGISYWKLAELYFDQKDYHVSKLYFDSTITTLPKQHDDYKQIEEKSKILSSLIESINTIALQDSLQKLAQMGERELFAVIDKIIADLIKAEEEEKIRDRERQQAAMQQRDPNMQMTLAPGSAWYFYNPTAINHGRNEFLRIWGERKLEDLWRLQNKEISIFDDFDEIAEDLDPISADSLAKLNNPKERAYYLKNIPDTPEKIAESNSKIEKAYYNAGSIYKDKLKDLPPGSEMFETLLQRFPETDYELQTYYNLYLIFGSLNETSKQNDYKNLILNKFPDSDFAKIITDPEYFQKIALQSDEVKQEYSKTWNLYQNQQYAQVIISADNAIAKYNDPLHLPKFEYLKAVSLAKTQGIEQMVVQLEHLIANYPNSDVKPMAEQLLGYVTGSNDEADVTDDTADLEETGPLYKPASDSYHLFVLLLDVKTAKLNDVRIAISNHNAAYYSTTELTLSTLFLNDQRHMITLSRFNDQADAERYFKIFMSNPDMLKAIEKDYPIYFVISTENYPAFYKDKDEQAYLDFFRKHYLIR
jgi:tetratricopeptide (TPR) repeat protein